jgi:hypothetical protein
VHTKLTEATQLCTAAAYWQGHVNDNNYAESMYTQCVLTLKGYVQARAIPVSMVKEELTFPKLNAHVANSGCNDPANVLYGVTVCN